MKKTLSSIAIALTLIFSAGLVSPAPASAAVARVTLDRISALMLELNEEPSKSNSQVLAKARGMLSIDGMDILILFVSGIIAAGLLKMADSLASTFGGDSGAGQISSNVSQSMQMIGGTAISKAWGATKTVAGWGAAGAWAGLKGLGKKGNEYDTGGSGNDSTARTPNEFKGEGEKPNGDKTTKTNGEDKQAPQGEEKKDDEGKNEEETPLTEEGSNTGQSKTGQPKTGQPKTGTNTGTNSGNSADGSGSDDNKDPDSSADSDNSGETS